MIVHYLKNETFQDDIKSKGKIKKQINIKKVYYYFFLEISDYTYIYIYYI